jgi:Rrf2 family protein
MANVLKMSDATALGLHAVAYLADRADRPVSTREIATELKGSEAHLSKILQRLARGGIVKSVRGPKGGFALAGGAQRKSLLDVYECLEGPFEVRACMFDEPVCGRAACLMADWLQKSSADLKKQLAEAKLSRVAGRK